MFWFILIVLIIIIYTLWLTKEQMDGYSKEHKAKLKKDEMERKNHLPLPEVEKGSMWDLSIEEMNR